MNPKILPYIDFSWTLFLDRDGVINKKIKDGYVKNIDEFIFLPKVIEALSLLTPMFHKIIIVTNQQGIGKGLMDKNDLDKIHQHFIQQVNLHHGRIDAIFFAPQLEQENSLMRKPNIGMALSAQNEFSTIDFKKSIMVGDSESDMNFAKNSSMFGVYIGDHKDYYSLPSLYQLFLQLKKNQFNSFSI